MITTLQPMSLSLTANKDRKRMSRAEASAYVRGHRYKACIYANPLTHREQEARRNVPGLSQEEWEERQGELSDVELRCMNFVGAAIMMEHIGNDNKDKSQLPESKRPRPCGIVTHQWQDPSTSSMFVWFRLYDNAEGRQAAQKMAAGIMRGFSLGHRKLTDGRLLVDEISYCWLGKRPGTWLVGEPEPFSWEPDVKWNGNEYYEKPDRDQATAVVVVSALSSKSVTARYSPAMSSTTPTNSDAAPTGTPSTPAPAASAPAPAAAAESKVDPSVGDKRPAPAGGEEQGAAKRQRTEESKGDSSAAAAAAAKLSAEREAEELFAKIRVGATLDESTLKNIISVMHRYHEDNQELSGKEAEKQKRIAELEEAVKSLKADDARSSQAFIDSLLAMYDLIDIKLPSETASEISRARMNPEARAETFFRPLKEIQALASARVKDHKERLAQMEQRLSVQSQKEFDVLAEWRAKTQKKVARAEAGLNTGAGAGSGEVVEVHASAAAKGAAAAPAAPAAAPAAPVAAPAETPKTAKTLFQTMFKRAA